MQTVLLIGLTLAAGAPAPKDSSRDELQREWGTPVDPDGDCRFRPDRGRLRITVPGTPHVMAAERGTTNGPRVVREIEGDFTVEVRVSGDFPKDEKSLVEGRWAFYGAGLLVWADETNYVRLERAKMRNPQTGWRCYPSWEQREDGKVARGWNFADGALDETKPAQLRITRTGEILKAEVSEDGKKWRELPATLTVNFGKKVQVGVVALQNTAAGYEPTFDAFKVTPAEKRK